MIVGLPNTGASESDWEYCEKALIAHSRTFAIPIALLPPELKRAVTSAYLLCRIADTVEDTAEWNSDRKTVLYAGLLAVMEQGVPCSSFTKLMVNAPGGRTDERELLMSLSQVMAVYRDLDPELQRTSTCWIAELVRGMDLYGHRPPDAEGFTVLSSVADLERYCYFVAGTIGHLLTAAFERELGASLHPRQVAILRANAEAFGAALQLVNILRDFGSDLTRGMCFVPRELLAREGLTPRDLVSAEHRPRVERCLAPLFALAHRRLRQALEYALALPETASAVRSFCLVPVWLAVASLARCQKDPEAYYRGEKVKLSREQVAQLVTEVGLIGKDNARIVAHYEALVER